MEGLKLLFFILVVTTAVGFGLSVYSNQLKFEDLARIEGGVPEDSFLEVEVELNVEDKKGIFAVQADVPEDQSVTAKVVDPSGSEISTVQVKKEPYEEEFEIFSSGKYRLKIENSEREEILVLGVIGPTPDAFKRSLEFASGYFLLVGLLGMLAIAILIIRKRKKIN